MTAEQGGDRSGGRPSFFVCPACEAPNPEHGRFCSNCGEFLASVAPAERRIVTVLFADLSGFTPLTERLDPEEVRQVVEDVLEPLCECVTRWGGFVDKFIGDCVMALFGAPVALENEAESALRAALDMHEAVSRRAASGRTDSGRRDADPDAPAGSRPGAAALGYDPRLSIGVNTGPVVTGVFTGGGARDYTAVGDVVNVAARLQSVCEPGAILVGDETYRKARHAFEFGEPEPLELKGRRQSVHARYLKGRRQRRLGTRGFRGRRVSLVGREGELDELRGHWRRTLSGQFQSCVLVGAPGIGKTRLVEALVESEGLEPEQFVRGRSYPYAAATPWETVTELLRRLFDLPAEIPPEEAVAAVVSRDTGFWTPQERAALRIALGGEPAAVAELASVDAAERRERVVAAATRAVEAGVRAGPRLLVAEDLHWSDHASLAFFRKLTERALDLPALALLVTRPPLPSQETLAELVDAATVTVELAPLSDAQSRELVDAVLGDYELPDALVAELVSRASGNPLFIEEALKTLQQRELIVREEDGVWRAVSTSVELEIPDSVESVLSSRIDGLHAPTKRVLQYASIVGRRFWSGVLADALAGHPVDRELAELSRGEFVRHHDESVIAGEREFAFQHLLLQEVAYEGLLHASRRELHGEVARWLEARLPEETSEYAEWLGYHYERSDRPSRAATYLERAARSARGRGALEDAAALVRRARTAAGEDGVEASLLCLQEEIAAALGDDEARRSAIDDLERLSGGDPAAEAEAAYRRTRYLLGAGRLDEAETVGRTALELYREIGDMSREADTMVQLGRVAHLRADYSTAIERYRTSLPLQREAGDRRGEAEVLDRLGLVEVDWGRFVEAAERFDAAREIYLELGDAASRARVQAHAATALWWLGCAEEAEDTARRALEQAEASGSRRSRASAALTLATVLRDRDHGDESEALLDEVAEFAVEGGRPGMEARAWLVRADAASGADAREHAHRAREAADRSGLVHVRILAQTREAEVALEEGDLDAADELSEAAVTGLRRQRHVQGPEERILWIRSRVLRALDRNDEASELEAEAREMVAGKAEWIEDGELRDRFLRRVPLNVEILGDRSVEPSPEPALGAPGAPPPKRRGGRT